jgi:hypothetical protein
MGWDGDYCRWSFTRDVVLDANERAERVEL